jgi:hypothetical protein
MLLLLLACPFEFTKSTKAIHGRFLAGLARKPQGNLLRCLLATPQKGLHTTYKTLLFAIVSTTTKGHFTLFTTAGLCNFAVLVLLAELAIELLGLWEVHHLSKRPTITVVTAVISLFDRYRKTFKKGM